MIITMADGSMRTVNDAGQISTRQWAADGAWTFLGFSGAWNARGPTWTLDMIRQNPVAFLMWAKGRPVYGWDRDHGHTRMWSSPSVRTVEIS